ncbi:S1C family serine protease [Pseudomonas batumici]|uniref:Outer membrane stress sensor protease DegQ, serine protease n=1 Tax=Pseudomonas batumici TaxID=226910 RepID=A0A0C2IE63_9PSED|nr:S1C family serine protease [Pseudomonas batumici]KIH85240.1 Outer membrane stress sensor protease DegQ, serine protease [Pseudomonas batumici]
MKPSLIKQATVLAAALSTCSSVFAMEPEALFEQVSPSIWVVLAADAQGKPFSQGTAVVVGPGRLVTNCHVLAKASSFKVQHLNATFAGTLEFPDVERDLCQIKVANLVAPAVKIAPISHLRVGQKVFAIGSPRGLEETMSDGLLSALRLDKEGKLRLIQSSAPISHGSSGGGLFNDRGELIGLTTLGMEGSYAQNISFAVPAQWIQDIAERGKAALATRGKPAPTPVPAPVPGPVSTAEKWNGWMSCGARADKGTNFAAYQARFTMEVNDGAVNAYRKNDTFVETLTGNIAHNMLDLHGIGYRISNPNVIWQFSFNGEFPVGSKVYTGKGHMLRAGTPIRDCDLTMTHS